MITRAIIVIAGAIAILFTVASHARAQDHAISGTFTFSMERVRSETCIASQYGIGDGYHGKRTASGAIFNTYATNPYTVAALPPRPLGSWVTVTNLANGKSIRALVNDRGPYYHGRCVDLGRAGANAIGMGGTARVRVE